MDFFNLLTGPALLALTDSLSPAHCERLHSPTAVLSMFTGQVLEADGSCQGSGQLGGIVRDGGLEYAEHEYGSLLQGAAATADRNGQHTGPAYGRNAERTSAGRMALAWKKREICGWHRALDARYGSKSGLFSAAVELRGGGWVRRWRTSWG